MDTYSHLCPNKPTEVADQLDVIVTKDNVYEKTSYCIQFAATKDEAHLGTKRSQVGFF